MPKRRTGKHLEIRFLERGEVRPRGHWFRGIAQSGWHRDGKHIRLIASWGTGDSPRESSQSHALMLASLFVCNVFALWPTFLAGAENTVFGRHAKDAGGLNVEKLQVVDRSRGRAWCTS